MRTMSISMVILNLRKKESKNQIQTQAFVEKCFGNQRKQKEARIKYLLFSSPCTVTHPTEIL